MKNAKMYKCVRDLQGGDFAVGEVLTAEGWGERAYDWANSDGWEHPEECLLENFKTEEELISFIRDMWELDIREVFVITLEQEKEFLKCFDSGDIAGLTYLADIICESKDATDEIKDLACCVIKMNYLLSICEDENYESFDKYYMEIETLYRHLRDELFQMTSLYEEDICEKRGKR